MTSNLDGPFRRLLFIDGLRGILAFLVMLSHTLGSAVGWAPDRPFTGAFYSVCSFFIVSGFVLTLAIDNNPEISYLKFGVMRFARLWPMLFVCSALIALLYFNNAARGLYVPSPDSLTLNNFIMSVSFLADTGLIESTSIDPPAWSIGLEFLISAFLLYFLVRLNPYFVFGFGLVSIICLINFTNISDTGRSIAFINLGGCVAIACFCLGIGLARFKFIFKPKIFVLFNFVQILSFLTLLFFIYMPAFDSFAILPILGTIVLLYGSNSRKTTLVQDILKTKVLVYLGKISYSLYLSHTLIILLVDPQSASAQYGVPLTVGVTVLICLVSSHVFYFHIELPTRKILVRKIKAARF